MGSMDTLPRRADGKIDWGRVPSRLDKRRLKGKLRLTADAAERDELTREAELAARPARELMVLVRDVELQDRPDGRVTHVKAGTLVLRCNRADDPLMIWWYAAAGCCLIEGVPTYVTLADDALRPAPEGTPWPAGWAPDRE